MYAQYAEPPPDILAKIDEFIACADWAKAVARIRCDDCGHSYLSPFSCKAFHRCPSCDQKRTILYSEYWLMSYYWPSRTDLLAAHIVCAFPRYRAAQTALRFPSTGP